MDQDPKEDKLIGVAVENGIQEPSEGGYPRFLAGHGAVQHVKKTAQQEENPSPKEMSEGEDDSRREVRQASENREDVRMDRPVRPLGGKFIDNGVQTVVQP